MLKRWFGRSPERDTEEVPSAEAAQARVPVPEPADERIEEGLSRTRQGLLGRLSAVFGPSDITDETWDDLEAQLILSDVGATAAAELVAATRREARARGARQAAHVPAVLRDVIVARLREAEDPRRRAADVVSWAETETKSEPNDRDGRAEPHDRAGRFEPDEPRPLVVLVVGVNGGGKTTTIAKLAAHYKRAGDRVLLVAADTFRAAAIEQLQLWGQRAGVPVVAGQQGGDPGAVVFDALQSSAGRASDVVIIDTAGRLHTQANLMAELKKVRHVAGRIVLDAPHETLLVLDATTGQNGLAQARAFSEAVDVTGLVLAKLDSSARGGVALAIAQELGLPIWFVGTGEQLEDLTPFDAVAYADGLLGRVDGPRRTVDG